jgi:hypothetical protein
MYQATASLLGQASKGENCEENIGDLSFIAQAS